MQSEPPLKIAVVDLSPIFARAVATHLETGLKPRNVSVDILSPDGLDRLRDEAWEVVLIDPNFVRDMSRVARHLQSVAPDIAMIAVATKPSRELVRYCFELGFKSFVSKSIEDAALLRVVRVTIAGGSFVDRAFGRDLLHEIPAQTEGQRLTEREEVTLRMTALGYAAGHIAETFGVSPKTVDTHRSRAMAKLGLRDRPALIRIASARGWLD